MGALTTAEGSSKSVMMRLGVRARAATGVAAASVVSAETDRRCPSKRADLPSWARAGAFKMGLGGATHAVAAATAGETRGTSPDDEAERFLIQGNILLDLSVENAGVGVGSAAEKVDAGRAREAAKVVVSLSADEGGVGRGLVCAESTWLWRSSSSVGAGRRGCFLLGRWARARGIWILCGRGVYRRVGGRSIKRESSRVVVVVVVCKERG